MNIGIITSADDNIYAGTLLARLVAAGHPPVCILCAEQSKVRRLVDYVRVAGLRSALSKIRRHYRLGGMPDQDARWFLSKYADLNRLHDWSQPLSLQAKQHSIGYRKVTDVNAAAGVEWLKNHNVDVLINTAGSIFRDAVLTVARVGMLNAHMGLLPQFRGMNVLEWSLWHDRPVGVTVHFIVRGIDAGDILAFHDIPIEPEDTVDRLRAKSYAVMVEGVTRGVADLAAGREKRIPQSPQQGRQYFVMHPRMRRLIEFKLQKRIAEADH